MKRITQRNLQNMYEPLPQHLMDNVDYVLSSLDDREERPIVKKISVSFVLAAVLIIASMSALAVGNLNLFKDLINMAEPIMPLEGAEEMIETNLGSIENDFVTLTVEEAIYDGQSVMSLVRITPKDIEKYAMLNAFLQDTPDELYQTQIRPVKVPEGTQGMEMDGTIYEIINEEGEKSFKINGEYVEIPTDLNTAEKMESPVYMDNGIMYYANQFDYAVTSRKDGRDIIDYWVNMSIAGKDAESTEAMGEGSRTMDAEEQPDGSVLIWLDQNAFEALADTVTVKISSNITVNGQTIALDDLFFDINRSDSESKINLIPEDGKISENVVIHSAEISFTKLRGNLIVEYSYVPAGEDDMGISMHLYDANGNRITAGRGQTWKIGDDRYREYAEIQSLDCIPEKLILEAKAIDGDVLGSCVCQVSTVDDK